MLDLFGKIDEFFKNIMIDIIKDNLSAMLLDINEKVGTVAGEVGKRGCEKTLLSFFASPFCNYCV